MRNKGYSNPCFCLDKDTGDVGEGEFCVRGQLHLFANSSVGTGRDFQKQGTPLAANSFCAPSLSLVS